MNKVVISGLLCRISLGQSLMGAAVFLLGGCNMAERLSTVGDPPQLSQIEDPTTVSGYKPVSMPMPCPRGENSKDSRDNGNSLWSPHSRTFFKDQRACRIGDILTVSVDINQQQSMEMNPTIGRTSSLNTTMGSLFGLERQLDNILPKKRRNADGTYNSNLIGMSSAPAHTGTNKYVVNDKMNLKIAASIIEILPNGNMVIYGRQEIRLVNEMREIMVKGIVRPEDIGSSNNIDGKKIAQLRIVYGGRGDLSDAQQIPWGQKALDRAMPF